jgi:hypothetical protein
MSSINNHTVWEIIETVFLAFSVISIIKQVSYVADRLEEIQSTKKVNENLNQSLDSEEVNYDMEGQEPSTSVQKV